MPTGPGQGSDSCPNRTALGCPVPASLPARDQLGLSSDSSSNSRIFQWLMQGKWADRGAPRGSSRAQRRSAGAAFEGKLQSHFPGLTRSFGRDLHCLDTAHRLQSHRELAVPPHATSQHWTLRGTNNSPNEAKRRGTNQPRREPQNGPRSEKPVGVQQKERPNKG